MKKYILFLFAAISCLQTNAQVMEVWNGSTKCLACKDDGTYKYTAEVYKNSNNHFYVKDKDGNTVDDYGNSGNSKVYSVRVYNKTCVWGTIPGESECKDLGLRDTINNVIYKVLWSPWNLGASTNTDAGCYFAWGEMGTEYAYTSTGKYTSDGFTATTWVNNGLDSLDANHDIARQWWGEGWQLPTKKYLQWIIDNCNWTHGAFDTSKYKVTNKDNTNITIYLPRVGWYNGSTKTNQSSNPRAILLAKTKGDILIGYEDAGSKSAILTTYDIENGNKVININYYMGQSIRPVKLVQIGTVETTNE